MREPFIDAVQVGIRAAVVQHGVAPAGDMACLQRWLGVFQGNGGGDVFFAM